MIWLVAIEKDASVTLSHGDVWLEHSLAAVMLSSARAGSAQQARMSRMSGHMKSRGRRHVRWAAEGSGNSKRDGLQTADGSRVEEAERMAIGPHFQVDGHRRVRYDAGY
jgi:hypothetical protein